MVMNVEYFISKRIVFAKENKNVFSRPIIRITISNNTFCWGNVNIFVYFKWISESNYQ